MPLSGFLAQFWNPVASYVIGHQRPDTDSIGAAIGYAWLLGEQGHDEAVAARAGQPSAQTIFALDRFEAEAPLLLSDAAPTFWHASRWVPGLEPMAPLSAALERLAAGERVVPLVDSTGHSQGLVSAMAIARALSSAGANVARALETPCASVADPNPLTRPGEERISDARAMMVREEADDIVTVDGEGRYLGVATRARLLDPPRARLILVDHNEITQAVPGADEAEIIEVLDHHRLGNPATRAPIPFVVDVVGSTCTLITERCQDDDLRPPTGVAGMLLSGILADTLVFRSPTCTPRDVAAAEWLAEPLRLDVRAYGMELLQAGAGFATRSDDEILDGDYKEYTIGDDRIGIAQVEVGGLEELPDRQAELLEALEAKRRRNGLALVCLMVTDIVRGRSMLLCAGEDALRGALKFPHRAPGVYDLGATVSRKKQLVPALHDVLTPLGG